MTKDEKNKLLKYGTVIPLLLLLGMCTIGVMNYEQSPEEELLFNIRIACETSVEKLSKYPSKVSFQGLTRETREINGIIHITGTVELMNGFGAMIPHKYSCTYNKETDKLNVKIKE